MNCSDFLALYSDWADGLVVDDLHRQALERHRVHCRSCGRRDETLRRGLLVLRNLECKPADRRFGARLEARLKTPPTLDEARVPAWAGTAAVMLGFLALCIVALDLAPPGGDQVAHATPADFPAPVIHAGVPFVTFQDRHVRVLVHTAADPQIPPPRPRSAAFR